MSIQTTADHFRMHLTRLIEGRIQHVTGVVASGTPADYASYVRNVGRLEGLRDALELMDEAAHRIYHGGEGKDESRNGA